MSNTGLLWIAVYALGCGAALVHPAYGLAAYLFTYYTNPPIHWWGRDLPFGRWSLAIAGLTLASYWIHGSERRPRGFFSYPQTKWLAGLVAIAFALTPYAYDPAVSWDYAIKLGKMLVLYYLMTRILVTPWSVRLFITVHVAGGLLWGVEAFLDPETEGGRLVGIGGPDTDDANTMAAHLLTIFPLAGYAILAGRGPERVVGLVAVPFLLYTFELLNSRGGMLGLVCASAVAVVWGWRRYARQTLIGLALGAIALLSLAGPDFWERQATVLEGPTDHSALSRLDMWRAAVRLIRDRPLGAGGHGFDLLSPVLLPQEVERKGTLITVHNTYLLTGAEWGLPGLACLLLYLFGAHRELTRLRRLPGDGLRERQIQRDALALHAGLVGLCAAGFFVNRLYAEAVYWIGGLTAALANLEHATRAEPSAEASGSEPVRGAA